MLRDVGFGQRAPNGFEALRFEMWTAFDVEEVGDD